MPSARAIAIRDDVREQGVLIALAATAQHVVASGALPELIVGHGVLGRLLARLTMAAGQPPVVWETNADRHSGAAGYSVVHPEADSRRDYRNIADVSGDSTLLDTLIGRLGRGGEIVLAGFYEKPLSFDFAPAFLREARMRVSSEFKAEDMTVVIDRINEGSLSLDGLITHRMDAADANQAYRTAFADASCLKMILDWRGCA